jgi:hypothetical protein
LARVFRIDSLAGEEQRAMKASRFSDAQKAFDKEMLQDALRRKL